MKVIIKENERAFLYKYGIYQRILAPGRHSVWEIFGESIVKLDVTIDRIYFPEFNLPALLKDSDFVQSTATIEVPDDKLAIHFVDGRISNVLKPGTYAFWNIYEKHTFEIIDVTEPEAAGKIHPLYMSYMPSAYYVKLEVNEGETALLYFDGVFQKLLGEGRYFFWNYNVKVTAQKVDVRLQQLDISGQEILTLDKVSLRINFVCTYQITDPKSIISKLKDYREQIYVLVQLVLREFAGKYRFDELLRQKDSIGGFVLEKLKEREKELFIKFFDAGVKDIILPGEIRDIMNTVLIAEKSAQASVITRREETAATKSLLETAKLMDENQTLYRLKELEYLERVCDKIGNISVESNGGILKNLREIMSGRTSS